MSAARVAASRRSRARLVSARGSRVVPASARRLTSLLDRPLTVGIAGPAVSLTGPADAAQVTATDVAASNGVIHAIDRVLLP